MDEGYMPSDGEGLSGGEESDGYDDGSADDDDDDDDARFEGGEEDEEERRRRREEEGEYSELESEDELDLGEDRPKDKKKKKKEKKEKNKKGKKKKKKKEKQRGSNEDEDEDEEEDDDEGSRRSSLPGSQNGGSPTKKETGRQRRRRERKARRARRERIEQYYLGAFHGAPSALVLHRICQEVNRDNRDTLWLAIVGLTDLLVHQRVEHAQYRQMVEGLEVEVQATQAQEQALEPL
eukprot:evm.model.NODE_8548_length_11433_cov_26.623371.2